MSHPFRLGFLTHLRGSDDPRRIYADRVFAHATELILQLDPIFPSLDRTIRIFEQIATQVAPALGWQRTIDGL